MKIVFYSIVLNHHQAPLADAFYEKFGKQYCFVELRNCMETKGDESDYSTRPYLLRAWESDEAWSKAMHLAKTADVCVFGGYEALPFEKARMKEGLFSFDMSERMLKRGWLNLLSPRILKMVLAYHFGGWRKKPLYKLCMSAFAKEDQYKLCSFKNRCYKWGYFTQVDEDYDIEAAIICGSTFEITQIMWCARFLSWKHPELPVIMARKLKDKGYKFRLRMYGGEGNAARHDKVFPRKKLEALIEEQGVTDCVFLMGNRPNEEIIEEMKKSDIFLFTSDKQEGWGAVANESLSSGCALVASNAIGSTPYLVEDGVNGGLFNSCNVNSLTEKVEWLLTHPYELKQIKKNAYIRMRELWSPKRAVDAFMNLVDDINNGRGTTIEFGPCSKA